MLKNYIKETLDLNKIDLSNETGLRLYYSKTKGLLSAIFYGLMMAVSVSLIIIDIDHNAKVLIYIGGLLLFTYAAQEALSRVFFKNPVLILSENKLYYIKTQQWYNLAEYKFEDKHIGGINLNLTFCMEDKKQKRTFALNNWHLDNPEDFKRILHYRRAMILKAKHKEEHSPNSHL